MKKKVVILLLLFNSAFKAQLWINIVNACRFKHVIQPGSFANFDFGYEPVGGGALTNVDICENIYGIISLSDGEITFDPWRDTYTCPNPPAPPAGTAWFGPGINPRTNKFKFEDTRNNINQPIHVFHAPFRGLTTGILTFPMRYRFAYDGRPGSATSGLDISIYQGYEWGRSTITTRKMTNSSFSFGMFVGVASVDFVDKEYHGPVEFPGEST